MLRLAARMPAVVRRGEPGMVEVELTNAGDAPVVVNGRLAPGYRDSSSRELFADVFRAGTDEIAAADALDYDRHPPQRSDYVELAPGEALRDAFDLLDWYRLPGPGDYELVVHYEGDGPLALAVPGLARGTFSSPRVRFACAR
jgi:hypothetical protein